MEDDLKICRLEDDLKIFKSNFEFSFSFFKSNLRSVGLSFNVRKQYFLLEAVKKNEILKEDLKIIRLENDLKFCVAFLRSH